jgi:hypothetical protein
MLHTNEPGTKPRPGVLLGGEPGDHTAKVLRVQTLCRRGVASNLAPVLAPFIWRRPCLSPLTALGRPLWRC